MSYWFGGGYPRGSPPNWVDDEEPDEKDEKPETSQTDGDGCLPAAIVTMVLFGLVVLAFWYFVMR